MKDIDWGNVGLCIWIVGMIAILLLNTLSENKVKETCAERGGNWVSVDGPGWTTNHVCQISQVMP